MRIDKGAIPLSRLAIAARSSLGIAGAQVSANSTNGAGIGSKPHALGHTPINRHVDEARPFAQMWRLQLKYRAGAQ
ncbi:hypothetical protein [Ensifer sp. M14]|uniref:hypothetical protein n=1 Tax=Ensifer sp. M14 TaxID=2203782 RepID=UPI0018F6CF9A|nr:hypothetical protein [Ensifer sp. M14]